MYSFECDYSEGAHPSILKAMVSANLEQATGYGLDPYTKEVENKIKEIVKKDVDVHFVVGGTQANLCSLSYMLKPYEGIIATNEAHIYTHETGAIEASGHQIITLPHENGKLNPELVEKTILKYNEVHMVVPKVIFVSNATELGTLYTKEELLKLREIADKYNIYLYMDGARLANALVSEKNDLTLEDLANIFDIFYIGGTKNGALYGEAIVVVNDDLKSHFKYNIKQKGALYSKGRFLAIQFDELFNNDLFYKLAMHANHLAQKLAAAFKENEYELYLQPETNQVFPIVDNETLKSFEEQFAGCFWEDLHDGRSVVRYTTSWATKESKVDEFIQLIKESRK